MTTKKNLDTKTETKTKNEYIYDGMNGLERDVKRIFDFIAAAIALILFSPLFIICYILIKKEDGGSVIFKQERIGRFGRPFYIYKFRSMQEDAEKNGPALFQHERDHRLTSIGKFLRTHHLDELPQLWNVLVGDMSFVGPRPERKFYIDQIIQHDERYTFLYQIRPGVTSYATLYNGYTDTMDKMLRRLELDLYYLRKRSWWFDIKILINTFLNIAIGKKF
ncbi:sugar transferase [Hoylesella nanceiensis]|jgi:bacterial sugar transferase|uniref:sugar transferase n=1 Tax=Hoylesella nanceiensis TaxID=425941 RepID=UPI0028E51EF5|nr:sugar transferase [Hoylesella nanceiensis]